MLRRGKRQCFHFAHVGCRSGRSVIPEICERLGEARWRRLAKAEHVMHHEHLAVAIRTRADSDRRDLDAMRYLTSERWRHTLDHDRECARGFKRVRIFY